MGACRVTFAPVPNGKRLVIEFVSLDVDSRNGTTESLPAAALFESATGGASSTIPFYERFNRDFGASSSVLIYCEAGETPTISLIGGASLTVNTATITGYLIDTAS